MSQDRYRRTIRGNILMLASVSSAVSALLLIIALSLVALLGIHNRLKRTADEVALVGACQLNSSDRIGQMNNMVARCRQLTYASRKADELVAENCPNWQELADQLLNEARQDAKSLELERRNLQTLSISEAQAAMRDVFEQRKAGYRVKLPWIELAEPNLVSIEFGKIADVDSNVALLTGIPELAGSDRSTGLVRANRNLYQQGVNAKVSGQDSDLDFFLSSLPSPIQNTVAPARVALNSEFSPETTNQLRSAVQVVVSIEAGDGLGFQASERTIVTSTAAAAGAEPMR